MSSGFVVQAEAACKSCQLCSWIATMIIFLRAALQGHLNVLLKAKYLGVSNRWTGFSTGTWDWNIRLECAWDWNLKLSYW